MQYYICNYNDYLYLGKGRSGEPGMLLTIMVHCLDQMNHEQLQQLEVFGETGNGALISAVTP